MRTLIVDNAIYGDGKRAAEPESLRETTREHRRTLQAAFSRPDARSRIGALMVSRGVLPFTENTLFA